MKRFLFILFIAPTIMFGQGKMKISKKDFSNNNNTHLKVHKSTFVEIKENKSWQYVTSITKKTVINSNNKIRDLNAVFYSLKDEYDSITVNKIQVAYLKNNRLKTQKIASLEALKSFVNSMSKTKLVILSNYNLYHKSLDKINIEIHEALPIKELSISIAVPNLFKYSLLQFATDKLQLKKKVKVRTISSNPKSHYFERTSSGLRKVHFTSTSKIEEDIYYGIVKNILPTNSDTTILIEIDK